MNETAALTSAAAAKTDVTPKPAEEALDTQTLDDALLNAILPILHSRIMEQAREMSE